MAFVDPRSKKVDAQLRKQHRIKSNQMLLTWIWLKILNNLKDLLGGIFTVFWILKQPQSEQPSIDTTTKSWLTQLVFSCKSCSGAASFERLYSFVASACFVHIKFIHLILLHCFHALSLSCQYLIMQQAFSGSQRTSFFFVFFSCSLLHQYF